LTTAAPKIDFGPTRHQRLQESLERQGCAAALLAGPGHVAHVAGYSRLYSGPCALVVQADGDTAMFAPAYELDPARAQARADRFEGYGDGGFGLDLAAAQKLGEACAELLPSGRIGVASEVPGVAEAALAASGGEQVDFGTEMNAIRLIKDADECERITRAYELSLTAQAAVRDATVLGAREIDLYTAAYVRAQTEAGAPIQFAGDMLVGDRSGLVTGPVATPGKRRVQRNDVVVSDMAIGHDGYCGDTADTFFAGRHDEAERAYEFMWGVLERAAAAMRPGVPASTIFDSIAAEIHERYPDGLFPHHGGHGLGVTGFEDPHLIPADQTPLQEGMVIAIEPGVYFPGRFGIRVEHDYLVTPDGGQDLLTLYGS
jgi:Xaa-Pro aminopeptidase